MESSMERWAGMLKLGNKIGYICNYGAWMKRAKPVLIVYVNLSQVKKKTWNYNSVSGKKSPQRLKLKKING